MAVGAGYLFGAATTTILAMATLYALRRFRSSIISPLRLDSAGLEFVLGEFGDGPTNAFEVLRSHGIDVRRTDAEIEGAHARYRLQVRVHPTTDVHATLAELSNLPEMERVSLTGFRE